MIVFDLACEHDHVFEGWFSSIADFDVQCGRGLVRCPVCDSGAVNRRLSAPRLNLGVGDARHSTESEAAEMQAAWMRSLRNVIESTENVGERFAEEARRIHFKEVPERSIRGTATRDEADELAREGIEFHRLPIPNHLKDPLQ